MLKNRNIFYNKVVWLTGASSGIGEQLAYKLNSFGAKLIISSRDVNKLEAVALKCNMDNPPMILPLDLFNQKSLHEKCRKAFEIFGSIDFLFNIAGVAHRDFALNTDSETDRKIMQVNYFGTIELSKFVITKMLKQGNGHVVVISSMSGKYGVPLLSAYSASKHALHGFFDSLRSEISEKNVKITIIIPGFIKTSITENALKGDGTLYGKMLKVQDKGMPSEDCAGKILTAVSKGKKEVFIGGNERFTIFLNRLFPGYTSKFIGNHPLKRLRKLKQLFIFWKKEKK